MLITHGHGRKGRRERQEGGREGRRERGREREREGEDKLDGKEGNPGKDLGRILDGLFSRPQSRLNFWPLSKLKLSHCSFAHAQLTGFTRLTSNSHKSGFLNGSA